MELNAIHDHWSEWASSYGVNLRATTKAPTAKLLELDALRRRFASILNGSTARVLEMGCGNGINCIEMAKAFPELRFDGVDYVEKMVEAAIENAVTSDVGERVAFRTGDVLGVANLDGLAAEYDIVFTDRCLINLNSCTAQGAGIAALAGMLRPGGHLLMIENSVGTYGSQNRAREALGLQAREPAAFNRFFGEEEMRNHISNAGLNLVEVEDFSSLHDLVLYALLPSTNGGKVDYDDPIVMAATRLSIFLANTSSSAFGSFGQNRLYVCRNDA